MICSSPGLVGRRSVNGGYGDAVQAQVDAELGAMVDKVIEEHLPVSQEPRSLKNGLTLESEDPVLLPGFVGCVDERLADLGHALVEYLDSWAADSKGNGL